MLDEAIALVDAARESLPPALATWKQTIASMPTTVTTAAAPRDDDEGCR